MKPDIREGFATADREKRSKALMFVFLINAPYYMFDDWLLVEDEDMLMLQMHNPPFNQCCYAAIAWVDAKQSRKTHRKVAKRSDGVAKGAASAQLSHIVARKSERDGLFERPNP